LVDRPTIRDGLVGWWALNEGSGSTAYDASGNGKNFTLENMESGDWISGGGLDFGGTNERASYSGRITNDTQGTLSLWVKVGTIPSSTQYALFSYGGGDYAGGSPGIFNVRLEGVSGSVLCRIVQRTEGPEVIANVVNAPVTFANNGVFNHVAITSDGTAWELFVGDVSQTITVSGGSNNGNWFGDTTVTSPGITRIAGLRYDGSDLIHSIAQIKDVRLYNRKLSSEEIAAIASRNG
jgi:hypothetical protein